MSDVTEVELPPHSLVARALPRIDYADAFRVELPRRAGVDEALRASLAAMPGWVTSLFRARDAVVRPLGLKSGSGASREATPERFAVGDARGLFIVHARSEDEIVVGDDDRHLDFRASFLVRERELVVSTVVRFHNVLGRAYFAVVGPVHRRIVPALLRATAHAL